MSQIQTTRSQALARTPKDQVQARMEVMLKAMPGSSEAALTRFRQAALSLASNPKIAQCNPDSVVKCIYECARLNLIPDPVLKHVYVIPFKGIATLVLGYGGLIELAKRAEPQLYIQTGLVFANDEYVLEEGLDPVFKIRKRWWEAGHEDPGTFLFAYCISKVPGQERPQLRVISRQEGTKIGKASRSGFRPGAVWHDRLPEMCEKTAVRRSAKLWTLAPEKDATKQFREALEYDERTEENPIDVPTGAEDAFEGMLEAEEAAASSNLPSPEEGNAPLESGNARIGTIRTPQEPRRTAAAKPVESKPVPAPEPASPSQPQPKKTKTVKEVKDEMDGILETKLLAAGFEPTADNKNLLFAAAAGVHRAQLANHVQTRGTLAQWLIWKGNLNVMGTEAVSKFLNVSGESKPAPEPEPEATPEQQQEAYEQARLAEMEAAETVNTETGEVTTGTAPEPVPTEKDLVELWAGIRNITNAKAHAALKKLCKLKWGEAFDDVSDADKVQLLADMNEGKVRWSLFE